MFYFVIFVDYYFVDYYLKQLHLLLKKSLQPEKDIISPQISLQLHFDSQQ